MVWYSLVWCGMVWYGMIWYGVVWYDMIWCGMVWYGIVWCGVVLNGMVWYGIAIGNARKDKCECEAREHETNYPTPQIECALFLTIPNQAFRQSYTTLKHRQSYEHNSETQNDIIKLNRFSSL